MASGFCRSIGFTQDNCFFLSDSLLWRRPGFIGGLGAFALVLLVIPLSTVRPEPPVPTSWEVTRYQSTWVRTAHPQHHGEVSRWLKDSEKNVGVTIADGGSSAHAAI